MFQCLLIPNVLFIVLVNSAVLGVYVVMATEYAGILVQPAYNFAFTSLGYVQTGQIIVALAIVRILGYRGDLLSRKMAERRGGIAETEIRLIPIILPTSAVIISCVLFGRQPRELGVLDDYYNLQSRIFRIHFPGPHRIHVLS
jgi:hypothetical protein